MKFSVRRVITGHDPQGKAIVTRDDMLPASPSRTAGQEACTAWATERVPADNLDPADGAGKSSGSTLPGGVVFRIVQYAAGRTGRMHRTRSQDYGVVLSGQIVLQLDEGAEVTLGAGDVLVQRGTNHNWINRSADACIIAFVLVDAEALTAG